MRSTLLLLIMLLLVSVVSAQDDEVPPPDVLDVENIDGSWNIIETGEGTECARGTPYQFFYREGASSNLMVYFQGGGACWNGVTCRPGGTFDDTVGDDELDRYNGIFDFENPMNPIADYDVLFIPYCTADIHVGDNTFTYGENEINHNGYLNSLAAMDWLYINHTGFPQSLFITGSSAGAYGAIYHAPYIIDGFFGTEAIILGDAGVGITPVGWPVLSENWNMFANMADFVLEVAEAEPETFTTNMLYSSSADVYPEARFAQFTNATDEVQIMFYQFSGRRLTPQDWIDGMYSSLGELDTLDNFSSYVAPGDGHTILALPEFYTLEVEGVSMVDWLTQLLNGSQPESVRCVECDVVEDAENEEDAESTDSDG